MELYVERRKNWDQDKTQKIWMARVASQPDIRFVAVEILCSGWYWAHDLWWWLSNWKDKVNLSYYFSFSISLNLLEFIAGFEMQIIITLFILCFYTQESWTRGIDKSLELHCRWNLDIRRFIYYYSSFSWSRKWHHIYTTCIKQYLIFFFANVWRLDFLQTLPAICVLIRFCFDYLGIFHKWRNSRLETRLRDTHCKHQNIQIEHQE